jgi:hypothetical protein
VKTSSTADLIDDRRDAKLSRGPVLVRPAIGLAPSLNLDANFPPIRDEDFADFIEPIELLWRGEKSESESSENDTIGGDVRDNRDDDASLSRRLTIVLYTVLGGETSSVSQMAAATRGDTLVGLSDMTFAGLSIEDLTITGLEKTIDSRCVLDGNATCSGRGKRDR